MAQGNAFLAKAEDRQDLAATAILDMPSGCSFPRPDTVYVYGTAIKRVQLLYYDQMNMLATCKKVPYYM